MKNKIASIENFVVFFVTAAILVAVIFALGNSVLNISSIKKTYSDVALGLSFQYPANFTARVTKSNDISYIDVFPSFYTSTFDPKFIEIIVAKDNDTNANLSDQLALMLGQTASQRISQVHKNGYSGVQFAQTSGADRSIYSFYKVRDNLVLIKFNQQYYGVDNPLILKNNTPYTGSYYGLINSLQFF